MLALDTSACFCADGLAVSLPCFCYSHILNSVPAPAEVLARHSKLQNKLQRVSAALLTHVEACAEYACWLSILGCHCEASHCPAICGLLHIDCMVGKLDSECIACDRWQHDGLLREYAAESCSDEHIQHMVIICEQCSAHHIWGFVSTALPFHRTCPFAFHLYQS